MFPWNLFGSEKGDFDPFKYLNDTQFKQTLDQLTNPMFPEFMKYALSEDTSNRKKKKEKKLSYNESVYETHEFIYIRIPINDPELIRNIKIYYTLNKCMIDGLEKQNSPYTIVLPSTVRKKGGSAIYRDSVLEIRLPKHPDWQFSELNIENEN